jgi:hypothetical protein
MAYSDYEKFKWESMAHFGHRTGLSGPWYEVKKLTDDPDEQAALVRRLVMELFDDDLIFGAYAKNRDAYNLELHEFRTVSRDVVERELDEIAKALPAEGDPEEVDWFWVFLTPAGDRAICSQPAEAFLEPPGDHVIESRRRWLAEQGT